ncbi:MAG: helix-turn-helix domain-containing protein [Desulfobacteraceae bacterium]|nr:helix-turn-helix domain-containing protein [Desulfobacteraceae bacterium]
MSTKNKKSSMSVDFFEDLTGDIKTGAEVKTDQIGDRIKRLREEKGISIEQLSHMTGFESKFLEDIEKNILFPQLGAMIKLSKALESALQRLISEESKKIYTITRRKNRKQIKRFASGKGQSAAYAYMSLAPQVQGRHMEPLVVQLEKLQDVEPSVHVGEEFIFVMDGAVSLDIGEENFILEPGDSAYYLSTTPHLLSAKEEKATILAVIYCE